MKKALFLISCLALVYSVSARVEVGGYAENTSGIFFNPDGTLTDIANIRLENSWDFGTRGGIEIHSIFSAPLQPIDPFFAFKEGSKMAEINGAFTQGTQGLDSLFFSLLDSSTNSSTMNMLGAVTAIQQMFITDDPNLSGLLNTLAYSTLYPKEKLTLDRAVIKLFFKPFDLFVGRQMIGWGTGYAFNPTDVFNRKNPADASAPRSGVNALRVEIPFGEVSGLSLVVSPGANIDHTSGGFRLKGNVGRYDLSVSAMKVMTDDTEIYGLPKKVLAGADMAGQVGDVGVWAECAVANPVYSNMKYTDTDSLYAQIDAGLDYTFENGLYVMGEYYFNGLGESDYNDYSMDGMIKMMGGEMSGLGRHYLFAGMTQTVFDNYLLSAFMLTNLSDQSAMVLPSVEYTFSDDISLNLTGSVGVGDKKKTEYGSVHSSLSLKVTGYF